MKSSCSKNLTRGYIRLCIATFSALFALGVVFGSGCAYLDRSMVNGVEAREIIRVRLEERFLMYAAVAGVDGEKTAILGVNGIASARSMANSLKLDDKSMYPRDKVEACADNMFAYSFGVSSLLSKETCELEDPEYKIPFMTQQL